MNTSALILSLLPCQHPLYHTQFGFYLIKSHWIVEGAHNILVITAAFRKLRQDDLQGQSGLYTKKGVERKLVEDFEPRNNSLTSNFKRLTLLCERSRAQQGDHGECGFLDSVREGINNVYWNPSLWPGYFHCRKHNLGIYSVVPLWHLVCSSNTLGRWVPAESTCYREEI